MFDAMLKLIYSKKYKLALEASFKEERL